MSSTGSQCAYKGKKKALLIAVRKVKGIDVSLSRTHFDAQDLKELLISQFFPWYAETLQQSDAPTPEKYNYAEDDIVMLLDDRNLDKSVWPSTRIIVSFN